MGRSNLISKLKKRDIKAVLFDMDGILFDSMPAHAEAWEQTMHHFGITNFTLYDAYLNEGRTGNSTINEFFLDEKGCVPDEAECFEIYKFKSDCFNRMPKAERVEGVFEVLQFLKNQGKTIAVVTGSAQESLIDRLNLSFPQIFRKELMVTAFDVKHGKPDPEPYLMGLEKAGVKPEEALVIENAPLGVESAVAAGITTIGVNTGILTEQDLKDAGSDIVLNDMAELLSILQEVFTDNSR